MSDPNMMTPEEFIDRYAENIKEILGVEINEDFFRYYYIEYFREYHGFDVYGWYPTKEDLLDAARSYQFFRLGILTERQRKIVYFLMDGVMVKNLHFKLGCKKRTVADDIRKMKDRFGTENLDQIVQMASKYI